MNARWYRKKTRKYILIIVSLVVLLALIIPCLAFVYLNQYRLGGFPLGFWFSMQGSMLGISLLVFIFTALMNRLDNKYKSQK